MKTFMEILTLAEATLDKPDGEIRNTIDTQAQEQLVKLFQQLSNSFQPNVIKVLKKIETKLNVFALTLGNFMAEYPEEGSQDFAILNYTTEEPMINAYVEMEWKMLSSGQQDQYRSEGSELRYDMKIHLVMVEPGDLDFIDESEEISEDVESFLEEGLDKEAVIKNYKERISKMKDNMLRNDVPSEKAKIQAAINDLNKKISVLMKEDLDEEQIDELSKSTLGSYVKKAGVEKTVSALAMGRNSNSDEYHAARKNINKRHAGTIKAVDKLTKEETELQEAVDAEFRKLLKSWDDKALLAKLSYFRNKDQEKYNAIVSEVESRGLKEEAELNEVLRVSKSTFDRKIKDGEWEANTDINKYGTVEIRNTRTKKVETIKIEKDRYEDLGEDLNEEMSKTEVEQLLKSVETKIASQGRVVDDRLLSKRNHLKHVLKTWDNSTNEEVELDEEQINELSKDKLKDYLHKNGKSKQKARNLFAKDPYREKRDDPKYVKASRDLKNRMKGGELAADKIMSRKNEEMELDEAVVTKQVGRTLTITADGNTLLVKMNSDGSLSLGEFTVPKAKTNEVMEKLMTFYVDMFQPKE